MIKVLVWNDKLNNNNNKNKLLVNIDVKINDPSSFAIGSVFRDSLIFKDKYPKTVAIFNENKNLDEINTSESIVNENINLKNAKIKLWCISYTKWYKFYIW